MYYPSQEIIVTDKTVIDLKTGQKFEFRVNRGVIDCSPSMITQQDIQIAKAKIPNPSDFFEKELTERRCEIAEILKNLKRAHKVIYSFI